MEFLRILFLPAIFVIFYLNIFSQESDFYTNKIFSDEISSVTLFAEGQNLSYPIVELNSGQKLVLEFDLIANDLKYYNYKFIHCNSDWSKSDLSESEYIKGFSEGEINSGEPSFNTLTQYFHYKLAFPQENTVPFLSGNYIIFVYENYDTEKPALQMRFYITENVAEISGNVIRSQTVEKMDNSQEIYFKIIDNYNQISTITEGLKVNIIQNRNDINSIYGLTPDYITGNIYEFKNSEKLSFAAGNEYRYFNTKNNRYTNERITKIDFVEPYYIFSIVPEKIQGYKSYIYNQDINGQFVITADNIENDQTEAEYVLADFTVPVNSELYNGNIYVFGALSNYEISEKNKMIYNQTTKNYELRLKLKQGFYNYIYVFAENEMSQPDISYFEGTFYETENDYCIFAYYRQAGTVYDRLIAFKNLNSTKK